MLSEEEIEELICKWTTDFGITLTEVQLDVLITRFYEALEDKLH
jgi:hypothetical protein